MDLVALEHGKLAYWADFALHGAAAGSLALALALNEQPFRGPAAVALAGAGWALWTLAEYAGHRWLLHGMDPFRQWHAQHHERPVALMLRPRC